MLELKLYEYNNSNINSISIYYSNDKDRRFYFSFFICYGRCNKFHSINIVIVISRYKSSHFCGYIKIEQYELQIKIILPPTTVEFDTYSEANVYVDEHNLVYEEPKYWE